MASAVRRISGTCTFLLFVFLPLASSQQNAKTREECLKLTDRDWGPNFGEQWHRNETIYWACRLGVSPSDVAQWQKITAEYGMIHDAVPVSIGKQKLVLIEEMEGTAHCFHIRALLHESGAWKKAWELPQPEPMEGCTLAGPALKMQMSGDILSIDTPSPTDPNEDMTFSCKKPSWSRERFKWSGQTFEPWTGTGK